MSWKKGLLALAVLVLVGGAAGGYYWYTREPVPVVIVESIKTHDLEALVSASGKVQPKRLVNISADTPGRVVDLAVNEGDRVAKGQFLLQIDPNSTSPVRFAIPRSATQDRIPAAHENRKDSPGVTRAWRNGWKAIRHRSGKRF